MTKLWSAIALAVAFLVGWTAVLEAQAVSNVPASRAVVNNGQNYEVLGHIGGRAQAIAVQGQYVYVGLNHEFAVLDASDPQHLRRIGYVLVPFGIRQIEIAGNRAYVFTPGSEVWIIDVTIPTMPKEVGMLTGGEDVKVEGNRVYVLTGSQLRIFDAADPVNPSELGHYQLPSIGYASHFAISGTYAYLAAREAGVRVIDASNPALPIEVGHSVTMLTSNIAIAEGYAYVLSNDLRVLRLVNPTQPIQVGEALGGCDYCDPFYVRAISHTVYVWWSHYSDVSIVNTQNPAQPIVVGQITQPQDIYDLAVQGTDVYVADNDWGVRVIRVANPAQPQEAGNFQLVTDGRAIAIHGQYAYVADGSGLYAIDVTSPTFPVQIGYSAAAMTANDVVVKKQIAYVATLSQGFHTIGISDPANLVELGAYPGLNGTERIAIAGSYVYVANGYAGMTIVDVADPAFPTEATTFSAPDPDFTDVAIMDSYAYLADFWNGLRVVDISIPLHPVLVGSTPVAGFGEAVAVADGDAYVATYWGLAVVDVKISEMPHVVGSVRVLGSFVECKDVAVAGGIAYLATGDSGVYAYDVRDPSNPVEIGHIQLPAPVSSVAVSGSIVYAGEVGGGLTLLRFSGNLLGHVLTPNAVPVPGVQVALNGSQPITTDNRGVYSFTGLPTGTYTVTPMFPGYVFTPTLRSLALPDPDMLPQDFIMLPQAISTTLDSGMDYTLTLTDPLGMPASVYVPVGAVTSTIDLLITPTVQSTILPGLYFTGHAYDLTVFSDGMLQSEWMFTTPLTMTISYRDVSVGVIHDEFKLVLLRWNQDYWEDALLSCPVGMGYERDTGNNALQIPICHTGRFALYGPTYQLFLPLIRRIS